jgi:hypothetical protein
MTWHLYDLNGGGGFLGFGFKTCPVRCLGVQHCIASQRGIEIEHVVSGHHLFSLCSYHPRYSVLK